MHRDAVGTYPCNNMKIPWETFGLAQIGEKISRLGGSEGTLDPYSVKGLEKLVARQLPQVKSQIEFQLDESLEGENGYDSYEVREDPESGKIHVVGSTRSALATGLYQYIQEKGHAAVSWTDSTVKSLDQLPSLCDENGECESVKGSAVVQYRYLFNTVVWGYTTAYFTWEDWEHLLDWAALHGINVPLAWNGYEQLLIEVLRDFGFTNEHLEGFLSGHAFLPWNRFGNVQGSWNATFDFKLAKRQLDLQKKIVNRMVELGMTPILPAFTGFVPREVRNLYPEANVVNSTRWNDFPTMNSNTTILEPLDPLFQSIQKAFLEKQKKYLGDVTHMYTLDTFNENTPISGDLQYLRDVSAGTLNSIKTVNPSAVWVMQGWLFYYESDFWTDDRIEAYLSGAPKGDMLILDLFSDHCPQWERTKSYYGHHWVYCELHDFGGNMGLEGSMQFLTQNFTTARLSNPSLVGVGLTPEGNEGNQIVYDIMLAQAWSKQPLDLHEYTAKYIKSRYGPKDVPEIVIDTWKALVDLVYTNDQTTGVYAVSKSMFEERPALNGISDKPGIQPTRLAYNPQELEEIWEIFISWVIENPEWLEQPHFNHDIVDITRQVIANRFLPAYLEFVSLYAQGASRDALLNQGDKMLSILRQLDTLLYTNDDFCLGRWISAAKNLGSKNFDQISEFQARNQLTMWGPHAQINDYASKQWAGLVGDYHLRRWAQFINFIAERRSEKSRGMLFQNYINLINDFSSMLGFGGSYTIDKEADEEFQEIALSFEESWQWERWGSHPDQSWTSKGDLLSVLKELTQS